MESNVSCFTVISCHNLFFFFFPQYLHLDYRCNFLHFLKYQLRIRSMILTIGYSLGITLSVDPYSDVTSLLGNAPSPEQRLIPLSSNPMAAFPGHITAPRLLNQMALCIISP